MRKFGHTVNQDLSSGWREADPDLAVALSSVGVVPSSLKRMVIPLVRSTYVSKHTDSSVEFIAIYVLMCLYRGVGIIWFSLARGKKLCLVYAGWLVCYRT